MGRSAWLLAVAAGGLIGIAALASRARMVGAPSSSTDYGRRHRAASTETATFAAGCFWKLERDLRKLPGVLSTTAGYTGGRELDPTHSSVSSGRTGHAEAVQVTFDPSVVSFERLLDTFWASHDPTQFASEPGDARTASEMAGRSAVFYHGPAQRDAAEVSKQGLQASGKYSGEIPTRILPAATFHAAEAEHQQYLDKQAARCGVR